MLFLRLILAVPLFLAGLALIFIGSLVVGRKADLDDYRYQPNNGDDGLSLAMREARRRLAGLSAA